MPIEQTEPWRVAWFCASCDGELSWGQVMYSHGMCPRCGHKGRGAVTIVDTMERSYRLSPRPWWRFWERRSREWRDPLVKCHRCVRTFRAGTVHECKEGVAVYLFNAVQRGSTQGRTD